MSKLKKNQGKDLEGLCVKKKTKTTNPKQHKTHQTRKKQDQNQQTKPNKTKRVVNVWLVEILI